MRRSFAFVALLAASTAQAQAGALNPGARVRITAPGVVADDYEGTVLSRSADTLVIGSTNLAPIAVPVSRITGLSMSRGKSRSAGAVRGMNWGAGVLGGLGLVLAATAKPCTTCRDSTITMGDRIGGVIAFSVVGAIYGAPIGALIGTERWETFDLKLRTSIHHSDDGRFGLSFSRSF
jgi:hypothetical protein